MFIQLTSRQMINDAQIVDLKYTPAKPERMEFDPVDQATMRNLSALAQAKVCGDPAAILAAPSAQAQIQQSSRVLMASEIFTLTRWGQRCSVSISKVNGVPVSVTLCRYRWGMVVHKNVTPSSVNRLHRLFKEQRGW